MSDARRGNCGIVALMAPPPASMCQAESVWLQSASCSGGDLQTPHTQTISPSAITYSHRPFRLSQKNPHRELSYLRRCSSDGGLNTTGEWKGKVERLLRAREEAEEGMSDDYSFPGQGSSYPSPLHLTMSYHLTIVNNQPTVSKGSKVCTEKLSK